MNKQNPKAKGLRPFLLTILTLVTAGFLAACNSSTVAYLTVASDASASTPAMLALTAGPAGTETATPAAQASPSALPPASETQTGASGATLAPAATPETSSTPEAAAPPTPEPTAKPTAKPAAKPAPKKTATPVVKPTTEPTASPAADPTAAPSAPAEPTPEPTQPPASGGEPAQENKMIALVNGEREQAGLPALQYDSGLRSGALKHSNDMSMNDFFSHTSPTCGSFSQRLNASGVSYSSAGENIAMYGSVTSAHEGLMNSEGHRANILNETYTRIGIGIVYNESKKVYYITQWFAK